MSRTASVLQIQAERIRSVQGILQRFRTLFNLPSTIRGCIIKGEYDLAVREYKKAKSLVLPTNVQESKHFSFEIGVLGLWRQHLTFHKIGINQNAMDILTVKCFCVGNSFEESS